MHAFNQDQHEIAKEFEKLGVPLAYAYNAVETLPYHKFPKPKNWDTQTLALVKRSTPTPLPGSVPTAWCHQSLLDWLNGSHGSSGADLFGRVHGAVKGVEDLRNGILVLLYSVPHDTVAALQPADILRTVKVLKESESTLSIKELGLLKELMGASADVFNRFVGAAPRADNAIDNSHRARPRK
ncbi:MAG: hypothetical protein EPN62_11425 [Candidimonas sp.]|nr:MAG: hypothetical protein EPN77_06400 [Candidimonas sp.]TAM22619.1 MAG: hypothetical protein EPN62_11425 [Candidimonas sp.]